MSINKRIYADNGATTKTSDAAITAMMPYMDKIYGNPSSLHSAGQEAAEALKDARQRCAAVLGCMENEVYFTSGGSESDNQAIISAAISGKKKGKGHIISTEIEHHAVLHTLDKLKRHGFDVTLLPAHENGIIIPEELEAEIRPDTALVSVMYANNEIGTIQPIRKIGEICQSRGVIFHTDAVQAAGHIPVNMSEDMTDMMSLSAHKFHGPKGAGILCCRYGVSLTPLIEGGAQERGRRGGTENLPAIMGMAAALEESVKNMKSSSAKLISMRDRLIRGLLQIPRTILNGDAEKRLPGNVNVCFEGIEGESLLLLLDDRGICASSGSACTSGSLDPSHVLLAIGRPHEIAHGSLRLTLSDENTEEEIDYILREIPKAVEYLRSISPVWHDLEMGVLEHVIQ